MTISIEATFENGAFKPVQAVSLPEGTAVHLQVSPLDPEFGRMEAVVGIDSRRSDSDQNHGGHMYGDRSAPCKAGNDDRDPLEEVIGICDDGPDISLAEHHDEFLYGFKAERTPRE